MAALLAPAALVSALTAAAAAVEVPRVEIAPGVRLPWVQCAPPLLGLGRVTSVGGGWGGRL